MWKARRFTNLIRYFMDDWLPPIVRESRLLNLVLVRLFHGKNFDLDFKRNAVAMTDQQFAAAYDLLGSGQKKRYRLSDMTQAEMDWILQQVQGKDVLEVGCGQGVLAKKLADRGDLRVSATELSESSLAQCREYLQTARAPVHLVTATLESLPFPDKSFDTTICAHTLEHVLRFEKAVVELVRVTRQRLLVVVPCQRYYYYTIDYHLQFFPEPEQLMLRMALPQARCRKVTGDLCYVADLAGPITNS
jgi:ubiquinone/menaquinone biosynthesis C-methylase UbiE